jgi:hypothetical protein
VREEMGAFEAEAGTSGGSRVTASGRVSQPGLPGMDGLAHSPLDSGALRAQVLQRCIEMLAVKGPLRARDLASRLVSLNPRIDRHLVNSVLSHEGADRVQRDQITGIYRLKGR